MKKSNLIGMLWGFYLGATLTGLAGVRIFDVKWWIIIMPTILLVNWEKRTYKDEDN
jgi:hypothetical protein